jgi:putative Holliday junction resolvase
MKGERGPMALKVEAFAQAVHTATGLPMRLWDERLSTAQVERSLLDADLSRLRRKGLRDKLAAQVTLQSYLDAQAASAAGEHDANSGD